ncbi:MAG: hypothetical protein AAFV07_13245, partial [Bacteroidota bacterium]
TAATPIGDGFGAFKEFGRSPSETQSAYHDEDVLIPPAVGMQAVMIPSNEYAACNFLEAGQILADSGQLASNWGPANYLDFGTGLVNMQNLSRTTLEIGQGLVPLLNMLLGGDYLETLLRRDSGWAYGLDWYGAVLNERYILREGEDNPQGGSQTIPRFNASGAAAHQLWFQDTLSYEIQFEMADNYYLQIHYSNDDAIENRVSVSLDGQVLDTLTFAVTGQGGSGWNNFLTTSELPLGVLTSGIHTLSFQLVASQFSGVEFDVIAIRGSSTASDQFNAMYKPCACMKVGLTAPKSSLPFSITPNPIRAHAILQFSLPAADLVWVECFDLQGKMIPTHSLGHLPAGTQYQPWKPQSLPPGLYFMRLRTRTGQLSDIQQIMIAH